jgi:general secretion pathway protein F
VSIFEYKAIDVNSKESRGIVESDSQKSARNLLKSQNLIVVEIIKSKQSSNQTRAWFEPSLNMTDISLFLRQLASLLQAAMPIDEALQTIGTHSDKKHVKKTIQQIRSSVIEGKSLAISLQLNSKGLPPYFIATVEAGERSAKLGYVLENLADEIQEQESFKKKISTALIYPLLISLVAFAVVIALLLFVVPQIVTVFDSMNQILPPLTIVIIELSNFLTTYIEIIILSLVTIVIGLKIATKQNLIKIKIQKILARFPVIGKIMINSNAVRFSRTLALLHDSGTPILIALNNTAESLNYLPMKVGVIKATEKVRAGSTLFKALESQNILPPMTLYMLASGEKSAQLSEMLNKAADIQETELDIYTVKVISLFEPLMILFMGAIVLLIVLAILLPIFELNQIPV